MDNVLIYGAVLLLALLASVLPALAHKEHWVVMREAWRAPLRLLLGVLTEELGAVTTGYYVRGGGGVTIMGSPTPATAAQASQVQRQTAVITFGLLGDSAATFTHNWGLDVSAPVYRDPEILWDLVSTGLTTYTPLIAFDRSNTNSVIVTKTGGDACVVVVTLRRPHSTGQ